MLCDAHFPEQHDPTPIMPMRWSAAAAAIARQNMLHIFEYCWTAALTKETKQIQTTHIKYDVLRCLSEESIMTTKEETRITSV